MREILGRASRSTLVRLAITVAILWYLSTRLDMSEAARAVAAISRPHLALVLALVAVDRCVMILRWILLLRGSGAAVPASAAARVFLVSSFVGSFLPAGVGADAARTYGLSRYNTAASEALASVAVDRLLGILSLVIMGGVGLIAWSPQNGNDTQMFAAIAVLLAAALAFFWADRIVRVLVPDRLHGGAPAQRVLRVVDAVSRYRGRGLVLVHVMAWSLVVQLLRITQAYFLGAGLGLTVPFAYYVLFMPLGLLMLLLPISISGFGLPQGAIVWMMRPMDVPNASSFALSTLIVLTGLAGNLPGLWLWLSTKGRG